MRLKFLCILLTVAFWGCKTEEPQNSPTVITKVASDVSLKNATMNGEVTDEGFSATSDRGFVYSDKNSSPSVSDSKIQSGYGKGTFSIVLDKLPVNTKYYYKAYATNTKGTAYGEAQSFTTADYSLATLTTEVPKNVGYTTAELGGIITNDGGAVISERGVCFGLNPNPTISDSKVISGKGIGSYTLNASNLKDNSKYYMRAYAINLKGTAYGNEQNFTTIEFKLPTFVNKDPNSIGSTSFMVGSEITDDGGTDIVERGFCYSTSANPTISDLKVKLGSGKGSYFSTIESLRENTIYFVRSYAINSKGVGYSSQQTIKTIAQSAISTNLKEGLLGFYPLDGNANDASGNGNNLLIDGQVNVNTNGFDRFGKTKSCFGFENLGMAYSASELNNSNEFFAISYWTKTGIFSGSNLSNSKFIAINILNNDEELNFYLAKNYNYYVGNSFSNQTLELNANNTFDGNWHFFLINFDFKNGIITQYMDGTKRNEILFKMKSLGQFNFGIGRWYESKSLPNGNADAKFNRWGWGGYIDDVSIWNRTLSLDEIKYLYTH